MSVSNKRISAGAFALAATFAAGFYASHRLNAYEEDHPRDYIVFDHLEVADALGRQIRTFVSGSAYCPPRDRDDYCLYKIRQSILRDTEIHSGDRITDVIPNTGEQFKRVTGPVYSGKIRTFAQLKGMVDAEKNAGKAFADILPHYTVSEFIAYERFVRTPEMSVSRERCPDGIWGWCRSEPAP